jgi:predicted GNAT family N-acyltransferase
VIEVRRIRDAAELAAALHVRDVVFIQEQGVSHEGDVDGRDEEAIQLVATDEDGRVIGTCRVLIEDDHAKFGRLAVLPEHRGHGLGARLLAEAEREVRAAGATRMQLDAQTDALTLYERAGYAAYGDVFLDEGIDHLRMRREL